MPAIITHHLFGEDILTALGKDTFPTKNERDAFLIGNQGPDPLFYAVFSTAMVSIKQFGSTLHSQKVDEALDIMRAFAGTFNGDQRAIADAYLCGYICHFTLDSITHPFIFAQQYAIIGAGVEGLDDSANSFVHGQIEADLDAMMLYGATGHTVETYTLTKHILIADDEVLSVVDTIYRRTAKQVYGIRLPEHTYTRSVKDMRTSVDVLQSRDGRKRDILGRIERLVRKHSLAQAMSHRTDIKDSCDFDNAEHLPWENPFSHESSDASFTNLFKSAQDVALENLQLHVEGAPSKLITAGLDFSGRPTR